MLALPDHCGRRGLVKLSPGGNPSMHVLRGSPTREASQHERFVFKDESQTTLLKASACESFSLRRHASVRGLGLDSILSFQASAANLNWMIVWLVLQMSLFFVTFNLFACTLVVDGALAEAKHSVKPQVAAC